MRTILTTFVLSLTASVACAQNSLNVPSEVFLFKNVMVFDGVTDELRDLDVLVVGNNAASRRVTPDGLPPAWLHPGR